MLTNATVEKMHSLRLAALAEAFQAQLARPEYADLDFAERVGMLVDAEWTARDQKSQKRRLKAAALRHQACLEDLDWTLPRGLDRSVVLSLATCGFIRDRRKSFDNRQNRGWEVLPGMRLRRSGLPIGPVGLLRPRPAPLP